MKEIWIDIKGYEGSYQVSNLGRVKSLERDIHYKDGTTKHRKERIMKHKVYAVIMVSVSIREMLIM